MSQFFCSGSKKLHQKESFGRPRKTDYGKFRSVTKLEA